eukprot:scaffold50617_cov23-Prasinocladus_malaysianus.AAC.1
MPVCDSAPISAICLGEALKICTRPPFTIYHRACRSQVHLTSFAAVCLASLLSSKVQSSDLLPVGPFLQDCMVNILLILCLAMA